MTGSIAAPIAPETYDRLQQIYRLMARIRALEAAVVQAQGLGLVPGFAPLAPGQEAVAAVMGLQLQPDDVLCSHHRALGHALAKGCRPAALLAELYGRASGVCGGKGGPLHLAEINRGLLGANGIVGANLAIAAGAAHAIKQAGRRQVVACFIGDGAIDRGPYLEALNWAALFELPLLVICEDNRLAAGVPAASRSAGPGAVARAASLGLAAQAVDGDDAQALDQVVAGLLAALRAGAGPQFLLVKTAWPGARSSVSGPPKSLDKSTVHAEDPLERLAQQLMAAGLAAEKLATIAAAAAAEMAAAAAAAEAAPAPALASAFADVQELGGPEPGVPWQS